MRAAVVASRVRIYCALITLRNARSHDHTRALVLSAAQPGPAGRRARISPTTASNRLYLGDLRQRRNCKLPSAGAFFKGTHPAESSPPLYPSRVVLPHFCMPARAQQTFEVAGGQRLPLGGRNGYLGVRGKQGRAKNKFQGVTPRYPEGAPHWAF